MAREAKEIIKEIKYKIGYCQEVLKDNQQLMDNLVIIIPNYDYEVLAKEAMQYYILTNAIEAKFNSIMGYDFKISEDIDKIYIALDLKYESDKLKGIAKNNGKEGIKMAGLTIEQTRLLKTWTEDLWVLLDQDDFNNIAKIFKNAVDEQIEYEYQEGVK